ncbi:protein kinase C epsilon type-like [Platysternon megacephalum]|uniref:Protein kinase C epsilon type-like n=1 Tax=Platysternon megacephalum TaxID=55544 RepID=A0A4D9DX87_9SAUR|nr:protein kinase C epsilon type-like [Platysternon megacephalum]
MCQPVENPGPLRFPCVIPTIHCTFQNFLEVITVRCIIFHSVLEIEGQHVTFLLNPYLGKTPIDVNELQFCLNKDLGFCPLSLFVLLLKPNPALSSYHHPGKVV